MNCPYVAFFRLDHKTQIEGVQSAPSIWVWIMTDATSRFY